MSHRYTLEQKQFIFDNAPGKYNFEIAALFQTRFGIAVTESQIKAFKGNHKVKSGVPRKPITGDEGLFTREQKDFIKRNVEGRLNQDLADLVNETFGLRITARQMNTYKKNHNLISGLDCRFGKGYIPPNKGTKGMYNVGGNRTSFEKGHRPKNHMPVGSERVNTYDYVDIKIAEPNKWRPKHLILWEQYHGRPVPQGHVVVFGDRDRRNFSKDNLLLITRGQLAIMNKRGLIRDNTEFTKTGLVMARIIEKIGDRKRVEKQ